MKVPDTMQKLSFLFAVWVCFDCSKALRGRSTRGSRMPLYFGKRVSTSEPIAVDRSLETGNRIADLREILALTGAKEEHPAEKRNLRQLRWPTKVPYMVDLSQLIASRPTRTAVMRMPMGYGKRSDTSYLSKRSKNVGVKGYSFKKAAGVGSRMPSFFGRKRSSGSEGSEKRRHLLSDLMNLLDLLEEEKIFFNYDLDNSGYKASNRNAFDVRAEDIESYSEADTMSNDEESSFAIANANGYDSRADDVWSPGVSSGGDQGGAPSRGSLETFSVERRARSMPLWYGKRAMTSQDERKELEHLNSLMDLNPAVGEEESLESNQNNPSLDVANRISPIRKESVDDLYPYLR